jgi:hypothetical protein
MDPQTSLVLFGRANPSGGKLPCTPLGPLSVLSAATRPAIRFLFTVAIDGSPPPKAIVSVSEMLYNEVPLPSLPGTASTGITEREKRRELSWTLVCIHRLHHPGQTYGKSPRSVCCHQCRVKFPGARLYWHTSQTSTTLYCVQRRNTSSSSQRHTPVSRRSR